MDVGVGGADVSESMVDANVSLPLSLCYTIPICSRAHLGAVNG